MRIGTYLSLMYVCVRERRREGEKEKKKGERKEEGGRKGGTMSSHVA